jgi:beta-glucanase (GH16 family)
MPNYHDARRAGGVRGARTRLALRIAAAAGMALMLTAGRDNPQAHQQYVAPGGERLDLSGYTLAFEDRFTDLSIGAKPGSGKRWYNHTPWGGDFGDAAFAAPGPNGPFSKGPQGLNITARRGADGRWSSGLISSRDRDGPQGQGFALKYGYFEISAKLPAGMGTWPAFWLIGVDKTEAAPEIDVVEYYGGFPGYYHCVAHLWRHGSDELNRDFIVKVPKDSLTDRFNTFGVLIQPRTTTFFLNRQKVAAIDTPPEYRQPFYILANLAMGSGWPTKDLPPTRVMQIAYIRAYKAPPQALAEAD